MALSSHAAMHSKTLTPSYFYEWFSAGIYTWKKPTGAKAIKVMLWGAGGAGGNGGGTDDGDNAGQGGGGGSHVIRFFDALNISSSVIVTIGAGGITGSTNGGNTSFGSYAVAYGGGTVTIGGNYGAGTGGAALPLLRPYGTYAIGGQAITAGAGGANWSAATPGVFGGGRGGGNTRGATPLPGGDSVFGGAGGGGGGFIGQAGGKGGASKSWSTGSGVNGGAAAATGLAGTAGGAFFRAGGGGGAGTAGLGGAGGAGGYASGGGGGGTGTGGGGAGGRGGPGVCIIAVYW